MPMKNGDKIKIKLGKNNSKYIWGFISGFDPFNPLTFTIKGLPGQRKVDKMIKRLKTCTK